jgi:hypothetical protein
MAVTIATVIENMCLSKRQKADLVSLRSCIQTLASLTHFMAKKPDQTFGSQSIQNLPEIEPNFKMP